MKNIYKSLAKFQQECPVIHKATKGYGYTYADFPTILEVINPLLKQNGLGFTQLLNSDEIKTILFHIETGETLESNTRLLNDVQLAKMNPFQVLGSQVTYVKRYALSSMLGIVTDKDTDASGIEEKATQELENDLPWLNEKDIDKVVLHAQSKSLQASDLRKYYKISKANFATLTEKLK